MLERRVGHEPNGLPESAKLPHYEAFPVNKETTKEMKLTIDRWNLMRKCLLDNNLMEQK